MGRVYVFSVARGQSVAPALVLRPAEAGVDFGRRDGEDELGNVERFEPVHPDDVAHAAGVVEAVAFAGKLADAFVGDEGQQVGVYPTLSERILK